MRQLSLILGLVLVLLAFVFYVYNFHSEGFETIESKVQDRTNTLAAQQNPLTNPAAPIGISEAEGAKLQAMTKTALNMPVTTADGAGSYKEVMPGNITNPRIDNENSFLGLVKMCKDKGVGDNPFNDSAFAENCGMCITSGSLITGEAFNKPTGVVVYKKDKERAIDLQYANGYSFARANPSLKAATCVGANMSDASLPVLAITANDYTAFKKRHDCRESNTLVGGCAQCISNKEMTWVSPYENTGRFTMHLWGVGIVKVTIGTLLKAYEIELSSTKSSIGEFIIDEGTPIKFEVRKKNPLLAGPYIHGVFTSQTSSGGIYKLPIENMLDIDTDSGSPPKTAGTAFFKDPGVFTYMIIPQANKDTMSLQGSMPITLAGKGTLPSFDCPSAPLVQSQGNAELLIDDPCLRPKGQSPGKYSEECKKAAVLTAGCSTSGTWYKDLSIFSASETIGASIQRMKSLNNTKGATDNVVSMGCRGIDISTPCDQYLNGGIPDIGCLGYLYSNDSGRSKKVGQAYKYAGTKFTGLGRDGKTMNFCKYAGSLNPNGRNGDAAVSKLQDIARGYKGVSGIEAVKMFLSDLFMKATGNLDLNKEDDKGGRKTSWAQCFGYKIADAPLDSVSKNSINDVIAKKETCAPFPSSFTVSRGNTLGEIELSQDYVLSFNITPREIRNGWGNIIHFTQNSDSQRYPGIWFHPGSLRIHVRVADETDGNWGLDTEPIPINQKSSFRLECIGKSVKVYVNSNVYEEIQPTKRVDNNYLKTRVSNTKVNVYGANPWYEPANALIENFCYKPL
jgi:hypothetical protein